VDFHRVDCLTQVTHFHAAQLPLRFNTALPAATRVCRPHTWLRAALLDTRAALDHVYMQHAHIGSLHQRLYPHWFDAALYLYAFCTCRTLRWLVRSVPTRVYRLALRVLLGLGCRCGVLHTKWLPVPLRATKHCYRTFRYYISPLTRVP